MQVCKFYKPRVSNLLRFELLFARARTQSGPILSIAKTIPPVETGRSRLEKSDARPMPTPGSELATFVVATCVDRAKSLLLS